MILPEDSIFVLSRRFIMPSHAATWARFFNHYIKDPDVYASVVPTWYGARVVVWARIESESLS